jgi:hypothetical protein
MATAGGPDIERNGLVFGYDTSYGINTNNITSRFYPGAPTTNIVPLDLSNPLWFNEYSSGRILQSETLFGQPTYEFKSNDGQIFISPFAFNSYDRSTNDLTLSVNAKNIGTSTASMYTYFGGDYSTDSLGNSNTKSLPADNIWRRYSWTRFSATMVANYLEFRTANTGVVISCPQLEIGRIVTPVVNGTRSSTQSLIDLTRTSTIDVSNVSFNSTGQPTFDGTDDRIDSVTGVGITDYSQPFTMECIFMVPTGAIWANGFNSNIFSIAGSYEGQYGFYKYGTDGVGFQIRDASSGTYPATTGLLRDTYYHMTAVFQGGSGLILYRNGVSVPSSSTSFTGAPDTTNLYIGGVRAFGGNVGSWFQGEIPVAKYYNRALSAGEVRQNYNAYKNRFNI